MNAGVRTSVAVQKAIGVQFQVHEASERGVDDKVDEVEQTVCTSEHGVGTRHLLQAREKIEAYASAGQDRQGQREEKRM